MTTPPKRITDEEEQISNTVDTGGGDVAGRTIDKPPVISTSDKRRALTRLIESYLSSSSILLRDHRVRTSESIQPIIEQCSDIRDILLPIISTQATSSVWSTEERAMWNDFNYTIDLVWRRMQDLSRFLNKTKDQPIIERDNTLLERLEYISKQIEILILEKEIELPEGVLSTEAGAEEDFVIAVKAPAVQAVPENTINEVAGVPTAAPENVISDEIAAFVDEISDIVGANRETVIRKGAILYALAVKAQRAELKLGIVDSNGELVREITGL